MTMRSLLTTAATMIALSASGALAADMAQWPAPPVTVAPPVDVAPVACGSFAGGRQPDKVYLAPQVAYIVAQHCGKTVNWLSFVGRPSHEDILVYYDGGSMYRPDITLIRVPPWSRRPH